MFACVLLHEVGKDGPYITLRLRCLSNCFKIYLRNTNTLTNQHTDVFESFHAKMVALALATTNINTVVQVNSAIDLIMDELEDDD